MVEKPISGDEEQRRAQTRAAREQSGLPPEDDAEGEGEASQDASPPKPPKRRRTPAPKGTPRTGG